MTIIFITGKVLLGNEISVNAHEIIVMRLNNAESGFRFLSGGRDRYSFLILLMNESWFLSFCVSRMQ